MEESKTVDTDSFSRKTNMATGITLPGGSGEVELKVPTL